MRKTKTNHLLETCTWISTPTGDFGENGKVQLRLRLCLVKIVQSVLIVSVFISCIRVAGHLLIPWCWKNTEILKSWPWQNAVKRKSELFSTLRQKRKPLVNVKSSLRFRRAADAFPPSWLPLKHDKSILFTHVWHIGLSTSSHPRMIFCKHSDSRV